MKPSLQSQSQRELLRFVRETQSVEKNFIPENKIQKNSYIRLLFH